MSFWKILGGAAIGVGAIAAAPFTGGGSVVGAVTLAASLGTTGALASAGAAAAVGAYAGKMLSDNDEEKMSKVAQESEKRGEAKSDAKWQTKMAKLEKRLQESVIEMKKQAELIKDSDNYFKQLLALEILGVAVAWCDGECSPEERNAIDNFVQGINRSGLPKQYMEKAVKIAQDAESGKNIPDVKTAYQAAKEANVDMNVCKDVILLVSLADKHEDIQEKAFLQSWKELAA